jgi:hypothetical protein
MVLNFAIANHFRVPFSRLGEVHGEIFVRVSALVEAAELWASYGEERRAGLSYRGFCNVRWFGLSIGIDFKEFVKRVREEEG